MKHPIKILLVDDHEVVRLGLKTLLGRYANFAVVAEAENGKMAVEKTFQHKPDLVIMDLRLPEQDGIQAIRAITRKCPKTRIVVLTAFSDDELVFEALAAGASGYVLKEIDSARLIQTIEAAARGESLLDTMVTEKILKRLRYSSAKQDPFRLLSWQEKRILALIAEGRTNREIATSLRLSEKTIRNYVTRILGKLDLRSRTQAAAYAIRHQQEIGTPSPNTVSVSLGQSSRKL